MSTPNQYASMTQDDFSNHLHDIVGKMTAAQILSYGDVYTVLAEELNNEVLAAWEKANPVKLHRCPACGKEDAKNPGELCKDCSIDAGEEATRPPYDC